MKKKEKKDDGLVFLVVLSMVGVFALGWGFGSNRAEKTTDKKWETKEAIEECRRDGKAAVRAAEDDSVVCVVKHAEEPSTVYSGTVYQSNSTDPTVYYEYRWDGNQWTTHILKKK